MAWRRRAVKDAVSLSRASHGSEMATECAISREGGQGV